MCWSKATNGRIVEAVADIQARTGPTPPEGLAVAGRSAAAMLTACLIELSYYPEPGPLGPIGFNSDWEPAAEQDHPPSSLPRCRTGSVARFIKAFLPERENDPLLAGGATSSARDL